jgi:hypothetical protein
MRPPLLVTASLLAGFSCLGIRAFAQEPASVILVGTLQAELGCAADWDPACAETGLALTDDGVWRRSFTVPAGAWDYKAALNGSWSENYGANATPNGPSIALSLTAPALVKFYYSHATHWIVDSSSARILTAPGNFQSELGCANDWEPDCLRSWLQDPDGDGTFEMTTSALPSGSYEVKLAQDESWDSNWGQGGVPNGAAIEFIVPGPGALVTFRANGLTNVLTVETATTPVELLEISVE